MKQLYLIVGACLALCSCEKSFELRKDVPAGNTNGTQLIRTFEKTDTDSTEMLFDYDVAGRLQKIAISVMAGGSPVASSYRFVRDNTGKTTSMVYRPGIVGIPGMADSIVYGVHYPAGSNDFDYKFASYKLPDGSTYADSTTFTYSAGKISTMTIYRNTAGSGYRNPAKVTYVYDANSNITSMKVYDYNSTGVQTSLLDVSLEYDNKPAAVDLGSDAFLFDVSTAVSKNNIVKMVQVSESSNQLKDTTTSTITYQYNANNKPVLSISTEPSRNTRSVTWYYYR